MTTAAAQGPITLHEIEIGGRIDSEEEYDVVCLYVNHLLREDDETGLDWLRVRKEGGNEQNT